MNLRFVLVCFSLGACAVRPAPPAPPPPAPTVPEPPMPGPVVPVQLAETVGGGWTLLRGGQAYAVRGVGYHGGMDALVEAGGNAIRTWGIGADTRALLDEAWAKGVTVTLGIWLGHVEHGFDYGDEAAVQAELARARQEVLRFKDHPALLMWGVGNEVELEGGDDPRIWDAIEGVAKMIKTVDPHHPTMVVTAEIGAAHDARLKQRCPSIDVWGINSYGGARSLPDRLDERGWTGPIALTEFGGLGDWEVGKHPWGAPMEPTSTQKAEALRQTFERFTKEPRAVATFAFLWGPGAQPTDTWFPLFGPAGLRYDGVDALQQAWGHNPSSDRAPAVEGLDAAFDGQVVEPRAALTATLRAADPEGRPLAYDWILHRDTGRGSGAGAPVQCGPGSATWQGRAPERPGAYRLLAVARDEGGGAAYASARFHVGPVDEAPSGPGLPLRVDGLFAPSGWMGDAERGDAVRIPCPPRRGFCSGACAGFKVQKGKEGWSGVVWHHPEGNWDGSREGVSIPKDAVAVQFIAWGAVGGEEVTFSAGNEDADGFSVKQTVTLTKAPKIYRIYLFGKSWDDVAFGFVWAASPPFGAPITFYVADVTWTAD